MQLPMRRFHRPANVSDRARFVTGTQLVLDAGLLTR
jgi:hypothetical protein